MNEFNKDTTKLEDLMTKNPLNLIEFYASWCGPCKLMMPLLEKIEQKFTDVVFTKVDVDTNGDLKDPYEVTSVPTILLFKDGNLVGRTEGYVPEPKLVKLIEDNLLK